MASCSDHVIGSQFISKHPLEIKIEITPVGFLIITDDKKKVIMKVRPCNSILHCQRLILDADDRPIVMIREKIRSIHNRWNVIMGQNSDDHQSILTTVNEEIFPCGKLSINVYLGNKEEICDNDYDFQIRGSWSTKSLGIYKANSSTAIAQTIMGTSTFIVTIEPNVDYAFVVSLIAIVQAMNSPGPKRDLALKSIAPIVGLGSTIGKIVSEL